MYSNSAFRLLAAILRILLSFGLTACINDEDDDPVTDPADEIPYDTPLSHDLYIGKSGTGTGTVLSDPGGIDCGEACSSSFDDGTVVTLSAVADEGSYFAGWTGGGCAGTGQCITTMDEIKNITAAFSSADYASEITQGEITWHFDDKYQTADMQAAENGPSFLQASSWTMMG